jgi:hypothetical protein
MLGPIRAMFLEPCRKSPRGQHVSCSATACNKSSGFRSLISFFLISTFLILICSREQKFIRIVVIDVCLSFIFAVIFPSKYHFLSRRPKFLRDFHVNRHLIHSLPHHLRLPLHLRLPHYLRLCHHLRPPRPLYLTPSHFRKIQSTSSVTRLAVTK